ncbi:tetraacyldisaccharide 4'-kinase [Dyadobacter sp. CY323]|nr:tetraacyldisaccharide 4'-kinase [Dyadobacter sp. CY323]
MPLSWAYGWVTGVRNFLYDRLIFSSKKVPQFVISVGNLTVGGTGKTPVIEYLAKTLLPVTTLAILSRGYGRKTTGFLMANESSSAENIGDEPLQFYTKFKHNLLVAVCEKRVTGALKLAKSQPQVKMLLLDDAYQHRAIQRDINLLLNDYNRPFCTDTLLPAGRLRESRNGARRADAVIITKCPIDLTGPEKQEIAAQVATYTKPGTPVFFAFTDYALPLSYSGAPVELKNVKMVAGIADPSPFAAYLEARFNVVDKVTFPDHHNYTVQEVNELVRYLKSDTFVVTTEKDMVKLKPLAEKSGCAGRFAYIPVAVNFGADSETFTQWLTRQITHHLNSAER